MKIEIWAPAPYECYVVRPVRNGDWVLSSEGRPMKWTVSTCGVIFPILRESVRFEVDQIREGLRGKFGNHSSLNALEERELKARRKVTSVEVRRGSFDQPMDNRVEYIDEHGKSYDRFIPTQIRTEVEAWAPEGYRPVRYGRPEPGEEFVFSELSGVQSEGYESLEVLVVQKIGRSPTLDDLGKECRFWPDEDGGSLYGRLWGVELCDGAPSYYPINGQKLYENCEVIE